MYVRNCYIPTTLRIKEREEDEVSTEFIHVRLDAIPLLNVIGVYLETLRTQRQSRKYSRTKSKDV